MNSTKSKKVSNPLSRAFKRKPLSTATKKSSKQSYANSPLNCEDELQNHMFIIPTYNSDTDEYGSIEIKIDSNIVNLLKGSIDSQTHTNDICTYSILEIQSLFIFAVFTTNDYIPKKKIPALGSNEKAIYSSGDYIFECFKAMLPTPLLPSKKPYFLVFIWNYNTVNIPNDNLTSVVFVKLKKHILGGKYDSQTIKKQHTNKRARKNNRTCKNKK